MRNKAPFPLIIAVLLLAVPAFSQTTTNRSALNASAKSFAAREKASLQTLLSLADKKGWKLVVKTRTGPATLVGMDSFGYPLYVSTGNTLEAASSTGTNHLWSGGSLGLSLSGGSAALKDKLGIWDGGRVNTTHVEMRNRVVQKDNASAQEDHSTHVSGIMINTGINPLAKGMAYNCQQLVAYDYLSHVSEMASEGSNLLVSNHSYTSVSGWNFNDNDKRWEFYGRSGDAEDYKFGYYSEEARQWDEIAYNAPYYLIVKAAGNNRTQTGPAIGEPYFRMDGNGIMTNAGNRPAGMSSNNGYDIIATYGTSKNILTVGAIQPISSAYTGPSDVTLADFSSWGPTDDGRIKPDIVADGITILSSTSVSDNSYASFSGTSMASPVVAGSAFLLQEYYSQLHAGAFMRAATLKGLLIHTALEAGPATGPDYQFGWGVANMQKAGEVIKGVNGNHFIYENILEKGASFSLPVIASGKGPLVVTLCWTDPLGNVEMIDVLNNRTPKLVNDLDLRIKKEGTEYLPWKLNPLVPSAAAVKGDNNVDNVEKIEVDNAIAGVEYIVEIKHKGVLTRDRQAYSLIISDKIIADVLENDIAIAGVVLPESATCASLKQSVTVRIRNNGSAAQSNIPVTTIIKNSAVTIGTLTGNYPGTIAPGREVSFVYPQTFNTVAGNTYTLTTTASFSADQNTLNDQQISAVTINSAGSNPVGLNAQRCGGKVNLSAINAGGGQLFWYETATSTSIIASGYDTSTTILTPDKTYYAAVNDVVASGGLASKSISSTGRYDNITNNYIKFTTSVPLTLESVRLYTGNPGKIKFILGKVVDATHYTTVSTTTIDVFATDPTPNPGAQSSYEPADAGAVFNVNIPVPAIGDYLLIVECLDGATLFYNNGIAANPYPITVPNVISVTGNSATSEGNPDFYKRIYLGIYDLAVKLYGCSSARIPVTAVDCNNSPVIDVKIEPNPTAGAFRIKLDLATSSNLYVSIMNMAGQKMYSAMYGGFAGNFIKEIDASYLSPGVYVLRVDHGGNTYTRKLIILKK